MINFTQSKRSSAKLRGDEPASGRDVCQFLDLSHFLRHLKAPPPLSRLQRRRNQKKKHSKCSVSWKWPGAAFALLGVAPPPPQPSCEPNRQGQNSSLRPGCRKSHKYRTPLVHHLIPFYFTVSRPGATDPRAKHQASAPSLPISLCLKSMFVTVLLTFNASARACGQKRWQTKPSQTLQLTMPSETLT